MAKFLFILLIPLLLAASPKTYIPDSKRASDIRDKVWPKLQNDLKAAGLRDNQPIFIRILKSPGILELWVLSGKQYKLFRNYPICSASGGLGTKTTRGDYRCPEGYYTLTPTQLNPASNYHLAINVGYPNQLEQRLGYTGDGVMIHGNCVSAGCYAMTDPKIEEIYTMVYEAFLHGQKSIELNIFPFNLTSENLDKYSEWPAVSYWKSLKLGYDIFEQTHVPPVVGVENKRYVFAEAK